MRKELGKISAISLGYGGYQDAMFGMDISFEGIGFGVGDFKGTWGIGTKVTEHTKWSEKDRDDIFAETMRFINQLLLDSKKKTLDKMVGVPVELTFDGFALKSWRVLKEVI